MLLSLFLAGLPFVAAAGDSDASGSFVSQQVPKKFILEAHQDATLDALVHQVEANGGRVAKRFSSSVFTGVSVETAHDNVDTLQAVREVARAWPVNTYTVSPREAASETSFSDNATDATFSVHWMTGVDAAHEAGLFGKGARIAMIDSGVDYKHPALGGGFGPGFKVEGGYDLVGEGYSPYNNIKTPDNDPMDTDGHGTHVAGILAGKTDHFVGVAPEATLLAYKVFGSAGSTSDDVLVEATLMAFEAGADIITSSIGRASGYASGPWAEVCSRIVDQGVVVTISAGNDGELGPFFASSGSSGKNVLSVASVDTGIEPTTPWLASFTLHNQTNTTALGYVPTMNRPVWNVTDIPIVTINFTETGDSCVASEDTPDLTHAIALISINDCDGTYPAQKALEPYNARYILLHAEDGTPFAGVNNGVYKSVHAMIGHDAGEAIKQAIAAGVTVTADFTPQKDNSWSIGVMLQNGNIPSYWSSWGGTYDLDLKPDIAAPGSDIWSAAPNNGWAVRSGTSMACPYVAGVAALYIGKYGGRSKHGADFAKMLSNRIVSSGKSLPWQVIGPVNTPKDFGYVAPVPQVGSGLVNATKVLDAETTLRFDSVALNDTNNFSRYHKVDITNNGDAAVEYVFGLEPAGGFNAQGRTENTLGDILDTKPQTLVPTVHFPSGKFTVGPGQTKTAQFNFLYPEVAEADQSKLPIYSGKILVNGSNGDQLAVPYFGAAFDLKKQLRRKMFPDGYPYQSSGKNYADIDAFHAYSFNQSGLAAQAFPKIHFRPMWGLDELRWDIYEPSFVERDFHYPPVVGEYGYIGAATSSAYAAYNSSFDPKTMDANRTQPFPLNDIERGDSWSESDQAVWWLGTLANGSSIAPGKYAFRFAAQLPFSNPEHSDNWVVWKTPIVEVLPY